MEIANLYGSNKRHIKDALKKDPDGYSLFCRTWSTTDGRKFDAGLLGCDEEKRKIVLYDMDANKVFEQDPYALVMVDQRFLKNVFRFETKKW